jgi:cytidine deaminase
MALAVRTATEAATTFLFKQRKSSMTFDELYQQARSVLNPRRLSDMAESGGVGAALLTESGKVYLGVCIDTACSMGFCAEHAAAAAMVTAGENRVLKMIAVNWDGKVLPPCGRCREFISQLHPQNFKAEIMVGAEKVVTLQELLPYDWRHGL